MPDSAFRESLSLLRTPLPRGAVLTAFVTGLLAIAARRLIGRTWSRA